MTRNTHLLRPYVSDRRKPHGVNWRCSTCGSLLGRRVGNRLLIRFSRGHQYTLEGPVTAVCRCCKALNETF
jgi:hypothetical protein